MHVLRVFCHHWVTAPVWEYSVIEHDDGTLRWGREYKYDVRCPDGQVFILKRVGLMRGRDVSDDDAEAITGLYSPVSMDRLREMVHDS